MHNYKVLSTKDSETWKYYLKNIEKVDIYFTPEYCQIYQNNNEGTAQLFVYEEGDYYIVYPYLLRKIDTKHKFDIVEDLFDITTPYGYGGPLTNVNDDIVKQGIFERFSDIFHQYCIKKRIVTEFVRFHPIVKNEKDYKAVEPTFNRHTVMIELNTEEEKIRSTFARKCRNRVDYAIKHGLKVSYKNPKNLEDFNKLYYETMKKINAESYYFFSEDFFNDKVSLLDGNISLFVVEFEEKVIAAALFLHYREFVTYHFTGSDREYLKYSPYNLLICQTAQFFKEQGYKYLHLGGGSTGDDELLRFKRTFNKQPSLEFYVGKKIHCPGIYKLLTEDIELSDDYFPLYRHPSFVEALLDKILTN